MARREPVAPTNPAVPFVRYPFLNLSRRGSTWKVTHKDADRWPITLYARDVYPGTARLLSTLTLDRQDPGMEKPYRILTASIDLLIAARREGFAKEAAKRMDRAQGGAGERASESIQVAIATMLDALLERLSEQRYELEIVSLADVELPTDLTPKYAVWPIVPNARPGLLIASSGSGKSTLAAGLSIGVVTGVNIVPGTEARVRGPVLYIGQEEDAEQMRIRTAMITRGHQINDDLRDLHYVKLRGASLIDSAEQIAEACANLRAKLVVVDSAQATWGANEQDGVREHASRWYGAVEMFETPTVIIDHPSLAGMKQKGNSELMAAGTSVKRDRSGHVWTVKSIEIPVRDGDPYRYHVTLTDVKRNYVGRQPNITYETLVYRHEWSKFTEANEIDATAVVEASRTFNLIVAAMRDERDPITQAGEGWSSMELAKRLNMKDDRRIRAELGLGQWRPAPWSREEEVIFRQMEGTGVGRGNPGRFTIDKRRVAVQMSMVPGDGDEDDVYIN